MGSSSTTLTANFALTYQVSVSASPSNGGTVSGAGTYNSGQGVTVTATPNSGYCFLNWTENGSSVSTSPIYTFNVSGNRTLVANFVSVNPNSISVSGTSVVCGNSATLTASGLTGVSYNWYSDAACTQLVGTGATLTTPSLSESTTYYVKAVGGNSLEEEVVPFSYTGSSQSYTIPSGVVAMKMEVWGAQGGGQQVDGNTSGGVGGKGGYSVGTLSNLSGLSSIYVYVGGQGGTSNSQSEVSAPGGWNGGGTAFGSSSSDPGCGGGGATDIRVGGSSLYYRIMVAGGGGGGGEDGEQGGYGGGTTGGTGSSSSTTGGTQTGGGTGYAFGIGASTPYDGGAGGGGWYGGGCGGGSQTIPTSNSESDSQGGCGGSGYVWTSATAIFAPSGYSVSSSYYLTNAQTIGGNATMPNPNGGTMTGREGNGYARITLYTLGQCEGDAKAVTVTVNPISASDITVSGNSTDCGDIATLTASGVTGVTYYWYSDAACTNLVATGSSFTTPMLYNNTTYYVKAVKEFNTEGTAASFEYTGAVQSYAIPAGASSVKLEVWGAQGGDATYGGKGGYSVGTLNNLSGVSNLYVYVGQQPTSTTGGWNGGGGYSSFGTSGGGATDISLHNNTYNTTNHYNDRIIVAGGGGGKGYSTGSTIYGGYGGGLNGGTGGAGSATAGGGGASQTSGGSGGTYSSNPSYAGTFGTASTNNSHNGGGGGGGWYGGGSGVGAGTDAAAGGGSGYVWTSSTASSAPSGYSVSSSYYLTDAQTIAGNTSFPAPGGGTETGHSGHGYALITPYYQGTCESDALMVTITVDQPAAPTNLQVTNIGLTTATVSWDANGESSWQWSTNGANWTNASTNTVNLSGLTPGQTYTFQVKAVGSGTCESDVASTTFTTPSTHTITVSANPVEGGTVSQSGSGTYNHGSSCTVTATPATADGYHFVNWTENGSEVSTSASYTFNVNDNHNLVANFALNEYTVSVSANPAAGGTVSGGGTYNHGATANLTATVSPGYTFEGWYEGNNQVTLNTSYSFTVTSDCTLEARYTQNTYTITVNSNWPEGGSATGGGTYHYGDEISISASANTGFTFSRWSDGNTDNPRTVTVTQDATYVAEFTKNSYTITLVPGVGGNASGGGTYYYGDECTVTALPNTGYSFVSWTENGSVVSTNAIYSFTVTDARTLAANFELAPPTFVNNTVSNVTASNASVSGSASYTAGNISEYGFVWNTTGTTPTALTAGSYNRVTSGTAADYSATIPGTGTLSSNTLYHVWAYILSGSTLYVGGEATFTTQAVAGATTYADVHTITATVNGSYSADGNETITGCGFVYGTSQNPTIESGTQEAMQNTNTSFTASLTGLTGSTTYYVRSYVTNAGGTNYGPEASFTTERYYGITALVDPTGAGTITFDPTGDGQGTTEYVAEIGDGTGTQTGFPYMSNVKYSFTEMIYPHTNDMKQGDITKISFHYKGGYDALSRNVVIYLKNVGETTVFDNNTTPIPVTSDDKYYTGTITATDADQWVTIELDNPFAYSGTGNVMVAVHDNTGSAAARHWYYTETNAETCFGVGSANPFSLDQLPSTGYIGQTNYGKRPNIKFTIVAAGANTQWYSWGNSTQLTATPASSDYVFSHWTIDGSTTINVNPYTLSNITADHTITANFVLSYKRFINDGNWNVAANWSDGAVPDLTEEVAIEAHAVIPSGVIGYADNIRPITHANGSITIQDGGQLIHNNASNNMVTVTVENTIASYDDGGDNIHNKGYEIVSFPVENLTAGSNAITGVFTGSEHPFDFYRFDASAEPLEWVHMASNTNINLLEGYIYASQDGTTISVTGPVMSSASNYSSSDVTFLDNDAPRFNGWALMGNPFVCNAYVSLGTGDGAGAEANFYKLYNNTDYDEFIPFSSGDAVTPMGGVMFRVYDDDNIVYSRTVPSGAKTGILNVDVRKTTSRGTTTIDRARVRFGEGRNLEKFQFDTRHTKIYIPEGSNDYSVYYAQGAGTIPVNFKAQDNGRYTLDFSTEDVGFNYLHLIDNMNGNDVDLLQTPYYAFDAKSTDFASRFTLVFATGNDNDDTFAFFNNGVWIINNDGEATLQVVDALGRVLSSENISGSTSKAINVAPGVYMLRLINGDKAKVQKIVVKR